MFFSIILFLISLVSLTTCVILISINGLDVACLISMFCAMMTYLVGAILFYKKTNKFPLNDISEYNATNFKKFIVKNDNCLIIYFVRKDGLWICENDKQQIKLDLSGYFFQKAYLISFVVRNIRYPLISDKLPLKYLFKNSFPIKKGINIKLVMIDGVKKDDIMVVKNGISKYGFVAKTITMAPFYLSTFSNRHYHSIRNMKTYMDEERYKCFYRKF